MKRIFLFSLAVLTLGGCATTKVQKTSQPYIPKFDFTPPAVTQNPSLQVTFALVGAKYSEDQPWTKVFPFNNFSKNLSSDLQEVLTVRGYTLRGPFSQYDEITFPDKKGCDFVLTPILDVKVEVLNNQTVTVSKNIFSAKLNKYSQQATIHISGRVTLTIRESLSNELMSSKSIELPDTTFMVQGEKVYGYDDLPLSEIKTTDPAIASPIGKVLEGIYRRVMQTAWDHLNPDEMAILKNQAEEIKKKKVY